MNRFRNSSYFYSKYSLSQKARWVVSGCAFAAAVGAFVLVFQDVGSPDRVAQLENSFQAWQKEGDETHFTAMQKAFEKLPSLKGRYEGMIAQKLLEQNGAIEKALFFAHAALSRVEEEIPFHVAYSEASLLIEEGKYQEALNSSFALKEKMEKEALKEKKEGVFLYVHNLLRIAFLEQELGDRAGERKALEEIELFCEQKGGAVSTILHNLSEKGIDLPGYIQERKAQL